MKHDRRSVAESMMNDENEIKVKDVVGFFLRSIMSYEDMTETGKETKRKLGEDQYAKFIDGFSFSFLCTLYVNAAKSEAEQRIRLEEARDAMGDALECINEIRRNKA